ncbi:MAG: single-stranded DNA-binding protein [Pseudonocardiaceae bacterium]|nr:single-stranded DNA-binding protein [Pseudonocardiaceae bacterium]
MQLTVTVRRGRPGLPGRLQRRRTERRVGRPHVRSSNATGARRRTGSAGDGPEEEKAVSEALTTQDVPRQSDTPQDLGTADGEQARVCDRRPESPAEELLVQEGDVAGDYLERLLDLIDYDGDIDLDVDGGRAVVSVEGGEDLERLVGSRGAVLDALQELTRLAVQQVTGTRSRLMLDVAQWREDRRKELDELGRSTAEQVRHDGEPARLQVMTPFERKIVHDAVASVDGVYSESEGEEPRRRVVVFRST